MEEEDVIRLPKPLAPAEVGGNVTDAKYIKDGEKTQQEINEEKISDVEEFEEGKLYVRKDGQWSRLDLEYDENESALIINTQP